MKLKSLSEIREEAFLLEVVATMHHCSKVHSTAQCYRLCHSFAVGRNMHMTRKFLSDMN